jgi:hypothetical protein
MLEVPVQGVEADVSADGGGVQAAAAVAAPAPVAVEASAGAKGVAVKAEVAATSVHAAVDAASVKTDVQASDRDHGEAAGGAASPGHAGSRCVGCTTFAVDEPMTKRRTTRGAARRSAPASQ